MPPPSECFPGSKSWPHAGPVCGCMQWGTPPTFGAFAADHADRGELWALGEEAAEGVQVAAMDCDDQFTRYGIALRQDQLGSSPSVR
jgi:hypothetical protein